MSTTVPLTTVYANTRNGTATYVQSDGTIATQSALLTRTDHWISGQRGRLLEPSRTNSFVKSQEFDDATWGKTNVTVTANAAVAPDGTTTADEIAGASATSNLKIIFQTFATTTTGFWTASVFLRRNTETTLSIRLNDTAGTNGSRFIFNLSTGVAGSVTNDGTATDGAVSVFAVGDWWRVSITSNLVSALTGVQLNIQHETFGPSTSTNSYYAWGAQLEQGAFPTTYIPTSTVAVPRLADRASVALSDIGFDAAGGSIFIEGRVYYNASGSGFPRVFQIDDGTSNNRLVIFINESTGNFSFEVYSGGSGFAFETVSYTSGAYFKAGIRYENNNCVLSLGGSDSGADTSVTLPSGLTTLRWQADEVGANAGAVVHITKFATYAKEFSDATLNAETA